jgi:hypothetical protein
MNLRVQIEVDVRIPMPIGAIDSRGNREKSK